MAARHTGEWRSAWQSLLRLTRHLLTGLIFWLLFFAFVTWNEFRARLEAEGGH